MLFSCRNTSTIVGRFHVLHAHAPQRGQILQRLAQSLGIVLEIGSGDAVHGYAVTVARQCRRFNRVRLQLRQLDRESAFPTQFSRDGLGKRADAAVVASRARENIR